jgi:hypothetical protein
VEPAVYTPVSAVANLRRSVLISVALGIGSVIVASIYGRPFLGMFVCVGFALGAINNRMLQRSVIRRAQGEVSLGRFNGGVFGRLGSITAIAILLALLVRPDGLGTFAGLAVFQVLMLVGAALPVFRSLRPTS